MRDGAEHSPPQAVDLSEQLGLEGLFAQLSAFYRQGGVIGEGVQERPILR